MTKILSTLLLINILLFSACGLSGYGKKVIINDKLEVYLKGDNVTEADARKLGAYIDTTWKDATNKKSFQLCKDSGQYVVRMVVDEKKVKSDNSLDVSFMALQMLFESQVFNNNKVKLILTDDHFKDVKTFYSHSTTADTTHT